MAETRKILWRFLGDSKSLDQASRKGTKSMGNLKKAAGTLGVAFGAGQLVRGIGTAVGRAEEMDSKYEITKQILEDTGYAAGLTADEIGEMSSVMSKATGLDKAVVTDAANVLLTFKEIKDVAGENNDIFSRSLEITGDMATVFGGSAKDAAKQLGKALNDPIGGMAALSRVGVQFTEDQKKVIASLVETGDLVGAQKVMLEELESQVGGTAEASADASKKIKVAWDEVIEQFGRELLPILEDAAEMTGEMGGEAEGLGKKAGKALVELGNYAAAIDVIRLSSDDSASMLDKLKGGANLLGEMFTGTITDIMGWDAALHFNIETANELRERLRLLAEESQNWRDAAWEAQGVAQGLGGDLDDLGGDADDTKTKIQELKDAFRVFNDELANTNDPFKIWDFESWDEIWGAIDKGREAAATFNDVVAGLTGPKAPSGGGDTGSTIPTGRHAGGMVPGLPGRNKLMMLQGGEEVTPRGQTGGGANITINIGVAGDPYQVAQTIADLLTQYEQSAGTRISGVST